MSDTYQDISWLAGQVFLRRNFVKEADEKGLTVIFKACPYGDLTETQKATFEAAFNNSKLRKVVETWWSTYDETRAAGEVPKATPWET
jgi:hypothetical protein